MLTQEVGQSAELKALAYLKKQGLKFVTQNYTCRLGEIDLIMRDGAYLVFIEVRARSNPDYGSGFESITYAKRQKIIKTTAHYLMINNAHDKFPIRFDVVSVDGKSATVTWLKDAFSA